MLLKDVRPLLSCRLSNLTWPRLEVYRPNGLCPDKVPPEMHSSDRGSVICASVVHVAA